MTRKFFNKYVVLLFVYIVVVRFIGYYGLRLYYTLAEDPNLLPGTVQMFQSVLSGVTLLLNLVIVVMMLLDTKSKTLTEWLIIGITCFTADIGVLLFLLWTFYKEQALRYETEQKLP